MVVGGMRKKEKKKINPAVGDMIVRQGGSSGGIIQRKVRGEALDYCSSSSQSGGRQQAVAPPKKDTKKNSSISNKKCLEVMYIRSHHTLHRKNKTNKQNA